jgi:hypothetical protein
MNAQANIGFYARRSMSAFGGKADILFTSRNVRLANQRALANARSCRRNALRDVSVY